MSNNKWLAELKTVFQVAKARLEVREKKKTEQVAKERYSVADYVRTSKYPRARIAVEHMVREDYKIEAMDRVGAYIDTLLMRLQLLNDHKKNASVDPAIEQPMANILWAAPYLAQDIPELAKVTAMFKKNFGIEYVTACEQNKLSMVDVDLLRCLSCDHIPKLLIEKYLVEICSSQNVPFEPDQTVMAQDEFWAIGQRYVQSSTVVSDEKRPPPPPSSFGGSSGGGSGRGDYAPPPPPVAHINPPQFERPPPQYTAPGVSYPNINFGAPLAPPPPPPVSAPSNGPLIGFGGHPNPGGQMFDPFPRVPHSDDRSSPPGAHGGQDDPGFDDLARRFEMLKKQK